MIKKINIKSRDICFFYFILVLFVSLFTYFNYNINNPSELTIFLYSWIVNIVFFISMLSIYYLESKNISIIMLILLFAFLFNFGQSFFWAFGIHRSNELGSIPLFSNYPIPTNTELCNAMLYSLCCYVYLVLGIILTLISSKNNAIFKESPPRNYIYKFSKLVGFYVIPATFVKIFIILFQSIVHGYGSLYYSEFHVPALIGNAENFFFPVIVGLLVGKKFENRKQIYGIFLLYLVLYLLAGERGNWIYKIVALLWLHYYHYRKIEFKNILILVLSGFIFLYFVGVIVEIRAVGLANINLNILLKAFSLSSNPFIRFIFEMGNSLGVTIITLSLGLSYFPVDNTFLSSILASPSSKIASLFNVQPIFLGNYLSQEILKINYGTGFNFFSEIYINGGYIGTFLYCIIFGLIIGLIFKNSCSINYKDKPLRLVVITTLSIIFFAMFRDSSLTPFKLIMQTGLLYPLVVVFSYKIYENGYLKKFFNNIT